MSHGVIKIERLGRRTIALISFLFGLGVLSAGAVLGVALPAAARVALSHPRAVVEALILFCALAFIYALGRPLQDILKGKGLVLVFILSCAAATSACGKLRQECKLVDGVQWCTYK